MHSPQSMQNSFIIWALPFRTLIACVGHLLIQFIQPLHNDLSSVTEWKNVSVFMTPFKYSFGFIKGFLLLNKAQPFRRFQHGRQVFYIEADRHVLKAVLQSSHSC